MRVQLFPFVVLLLFALLVMVLAGCGASTPHATLTGNWAAIATGSATTTPLLNLSFTMTEGAMTGTGSATSAPVTFSNLVVTNGGNCFDNNAIVSGTVAGAAGGPRIMNLSIAESNNVALLSLSVPADNNSASGSFGLTGGWFLPNSIDPCPASVSGTTSFLRQ
jgi:hypothetical protein